LLILVFALLEIKNFPGFVFSFFDIKVGLLLSGIYFLLIHLSRMPQEIIEIKRLKNLQTAIMTEEINIDQAQIKFSDLLKGLNLPTIFRESQEMIDASFAMEEYLLNEYSKKSGEVTIEMKKLNKLIMTCTKYKKLKKKISKKTTDEIATRFFNMDRAVDAKEEILKARGKTISKLGKNLHYQINLNKWIRRLGDVSVSDYFQNLLEKNGLQFKHQEKIMSLDDKNHEKYEKEYNKAQKILAQLRIEEKNKSKVL
jgi:hypothetical protein